MSSGGAGTPGASGIPTSDPHISFTNPGIPGSGSMPAGTYDSAGYTPPNAPAGTAPIPVTINGMDFGAPETAPTPQPLSTPTPDLSYEPPPATPFQQEQTAHTFQTALYAAAVKESIAKNDPSIIQQYRDPNLGRLQEYEKAGIESAVRKSRGKEDAGEPEVKSGPMKIPIVPNAPKSSGPTISKAVRENVDPDVSKAWNSYITTTLNSGAGSRSSSDAFASYYGILADKGYLNMATGYSTSKGQSELGLPQQMFTFIPRGGISALDKGGTAEMFKEGIVPLTAEEQSNVYNSMLDTIGTTHEAFLPALREYLAKEKTLTENIPQDAKNAESVISARVGQTVKFTPVEVAAILFPWASLSMLYYLAGVRTTEGGVERVSGGLEVEKLTKEEKTLREGFGLPPRGQNDTLALYKAPTISRIGYQVAIDDVRDVQKPGVTWEQPHQLGGEVYQYEPIFPETETYTPRPEDSTPVEVLQELRNGIFEDIVEGIRKDIETGKTKISAEGAGDKARQDFLNEIARLSITTKKVSAPSDYALDAAANKVLWTAKNGFRFAYYIQGNEPTTGNPQEWLAVAEPGSDVFTAHTLSKLRLCGPCQWEVDESDALLAKLAEQGWKPGDKFPDAIAQSNQSIEVPDELMGDGRFPSSEIKRREAIGVGITSQPSGWKPASKSGTAWMPYAPGDVIPNFSAVNYWTGKPTALSDLFGGSDKMLLVISSTFCGPCVRESGYFADFSEQYDIPVATIWADAQNTSNGSDRLGYVFDKFMGNTQGNVRLGYNALADYNSSLVVGSDDARSGAEGVFVVDATPTIYLISKDGIIIKSLVGTIEDVPAIADFVGANESDLRPSATSAAEIKPPAIVEPKVVYIPSTKREGVLVYKDGDKTITIDKNTGVVGEYDPNPPEGYPALQVGKIIDHGEGVYSVCQPGGLCFVSPRTEIGDKITADVEKYAIPTESEGLKSTGRWSAALEPESTAATAQTDLEKVTFEWEQGGTIKDATRPAETNWFMKMLNGIMDKLPEMDMAGGKAGAGGPGFAEEQQAHKFQVAIYAAAVKAGQEEEAKYLYSGLGRLSPQEMAIIKSEAQMVRPQLILAAGDNVTADIPFIIEQKPAETMSQAQREQLAKAFQKELYSFAVKNNQDEQYIDPILGRLTAQEKYAIEKQSRPAMKVEQKPPGDDRLKASSVVIPELSIPMIPSEDLQAVIDKLEKDYKAPEGGYYIERYAFDELKAGRKAIEIIKELDTLGISRQNLFPIEARLIATERLVSQNLKFEEAEVILKEEEDIGTRKHQATLAWVTEYLKAELGSGKDLKSVVADIKNMLNRQQVSGIDTGDPLKTLGITDQNMAEIEYLYSMAEKEKIKSGQGLKQYVNDMEGMTGYGVSDKTITIVSKLLSGQSDAKDRESLLSYTASRMALGDDLNDIMAYVEKTKWAADAESIGLSKVDRMKGLIETRTAMNMMYPMAAGVERENLNNTLDYILKNKGYSDEEIKTSKELYTQERQFRESKALEVPKVNLDVPDWVEQLAQGGITGAWELAIGIPMMVGAVTKGVGQFVSSPSLGKTAFTPVPAVQTLASLPSGMVDYLGQVVTEAIANPAYGIPRAIVVFGAAGALEGGKGAVKAIPQVIDAAKGERIFPRGIQQQPGIVIKIVPEAFRRLSDEIELIKQDQGKVDAILKSGSPDKQRSALRNMLNPETTKVYDAVLEIMDEVGGFKVPTSQIRVSVNFGDVVRIGQENGAAVKTILKKYADALEIRGSMADWVQMKGVKGAYRPNDIDVNIKPNNKHGLTPKRLATEVADEINKNAGKKVAHSPDGSSEVFINDKKAIDGHFTGTFGTSEFPPPLGIPAQRGVMSIDGINFEPVGNQFWHRGLEIIRPGTGTNVGLMGPEAFGKPWRVKDIYRFQVLTENIIDVLKQQGKTDLADKIKTDLDIMNRADIEHPDSGGMGSPLPYKPQATGMFEAEFLELFQELQRGSLFSGVDISVVSPDGVLTRYVSPAAKVNTGTLYHATRDIRPYTEALKRGESPRVGYIYDEHGVLTKAENQTLFTSPDAALEYMYNFEEGRIGENAGIVAIKTNPADIAGADATFTPAFRVEQFTMPKVAEIKLPWSDKPWSPGGYNVVRAILDEWVMKEGSKLEATNPTAVSLKKGSTSEGLTGEYKTSLGGRDYPVLYFATENAAKLGDMAAAPTKAQIRAINLMAIKGSIGDILHPHLTKYIRISAEKGDLGTTGLIEFYREAIKWKEDKTAKQPKLGTAKAIKMKEARDKVIASTILEDADKLDRRAKEIQEKTGKSYDEALEDATKENMADMESKISKVAEAREILERSARDGEFSKEYVLNLRELGKALLLPATQAFLASGSNAEALNTTEPIVATSQIIPSTTLQSTPVVATAVSVTGISTQPISEGMSEITGVTTTPVTTPTTTPVTTPITTPVITTIPITTPVTTPVTTPIITTIPTPVITIPTPTPRPRPKTPPPRKIMDRFNELTKAQKDGVIAWKQGWIYKAWFPPYGQEDIFNTRYPIPDVQYHTGPGAAYKSAVLLAGGALPYDIKRDMGIMDISINKVQKMNRPKLQFTEDRKQVTHYAGVSRMKK